MRRCTRILALFVFLALCAGRPSPAGQEPPRSRPDQAELGTADRVRVDALLQDHVARRQIAGAVALVMRRGQVIYQKAVGKQDVEAGIAMSPDTIFRIASMTKPITSAAVMMLVEQGRIDLSCPTPSPATCRNSSS
jgi:CubicO group peptidase (beta-lactamase class C family)